MKINEFKQKSNHISELMFDMPMPVPYMCQSIDDMVKEMKDTWRGVKNCDDLEDAVYDMGILEGDITSGLETLRSNIEELRNWGEEWKELAKALYDELESINPSKCEQFLSQEAYNLLTH